MQDASASFQTRSTSHPPLQERIGLSIAGSDAADVINRIVEAERAGLRQIWLSQGGSGGADVLTVMAMAAMRTTSIRLGTAIVPTYPRHPIVMAQQALAIHDLAPGRLRLGIGPSHRPIIEGSYGLKQTAPLAHLREYLTVLRGLLYEGHIDYHGAFFQVKATLRTAPVPLLISALGIRAFHVAGEISDGALSWICPAPYLLQQALPSLRAGAQEQARTAPPLVAHVVVALSTDEAAVQARAQQFLQRYARMPFYSHMFAQAGLPVAPDGTGLEALAKALVLSGDEAQVHRRLAGLLEEGLDELMVHALPLTNDGKERAQLLELLVALHD